jgi:hypothetical protein
MRHSYDFGADRDRVGARLVDPASWDAIRLLPGPFELPADRASWESAADDDELQSRAVAIARVADELGARRICSYGVGTGLLELNLTRLRPDLDLVCTDYAPRALVRLRDLFPEADVRRHDLLVDPPVPADLHLLHRVDSELANRQWREVLARFREPILLVATELLEMDTLLSELVLRSRRSATDAGYIRTEAALRSLWRRTHRDRSVSVGDRAAFLLLRR